MTKLEKTIITKCFEHFLCKISTFLSMSFYNLETLKLRKQIILILSCKNISFIFLFSDLLINFSKRLVLLLILQFRNSSLFSLVACISLFPLSQCYLQGTYNTYFVHAFIHQYIRKTVIF